MNDKTIIYGPTGEFDAAFYESLLQNAGIKSAKLEPYSKYKHNGKFLQGVLPHSFVVTVLPEDVLKAESIINGENKPEKFSKKSFLKTVLLILLAVAFFGLIALLFGYVLSLFKL